MELKKINLSNFKKYRFDNGKPFEKEFSSGVNEISGPNACGKTTLATAVFWTLMDSDFNLKKNPVVRHEVNGEPINDAPVEVELIFTDGDRDISFKKVQKRKINKDGSYADSNTYFVNEVERTMRDFNAYAEDVFGCSIKILPMCLAINAFLQQKPDIMRKFLFERVESKTDLEIAQSELGFDDLKELLEKYTLEEVSSLYKASKTKIQKTLDDIPVAIAQEQKHIVEMDTAEDELAVRDLEVQILELDKKIGDSRLISEETKKKTDALMQMQFDKGEMERKAYEDITKARTVIQKELDALRDDERNTSRNIQLSENNLSAAKTDLVFHQKCLQECRNEYTRLKNMEFDESEKNCPTCGQSLPEADIAKLIEKFIADKEKKIQSVTEKGNMENRTVKTLEEKIPALEFEIKQEKEEQELLQSQIFDKQKELDALPDSVDMSSNKAYQELLKRISDAEKSLSEQNTIDDYLNDIKAQKHDLEVQLSVHKERISRVMKNAEHEEEKERLENLRKQKEQDKANCEKILNQIADLDKKKNELLVADINAMFDIVKWKLFDYKKNGTYEPCCIPIIDGYEFGKTANKAREDIAKVDIAVSIQNMLSVNVPIVLDNAESLDKTNRDKLNKFGRQMILLCVA